MPSNNLLGAIAIALVLLLPACAGNQAGLREREIRLLEKRSDEDIAKERKACAELATKDYNCASLIPPAQGANEEEWKAIDAATRICRKNQEASFKSCLRRRGLLYSEFF